MICPNCHLPYKTVGNLLAGTFQLYEGQCSCDEDPEPIGQEEEGTDE